MHKDSEPQRQEPHVDTESRPAEDSTRIAHGALDPLLELTKTRAREFLREKEALFWVFVFPVLLSLSLGIAFRNSGPQKARIALRTDSAQAETIDRLRSVLKAAPDIELVEANSEESARLLRTGAVSIVVSVNATSQTPPDAGRDTAPLLPDMLEYSFDAARPDSHFAKLAVDTALLQPEVLKLSGPARENRVTESGSRYIDFLIPGLIGLNLMGSGMWGTTFTVVTARGKKLLKRFAATPMRRSHYLLSFMLARLVFLFIEVGFMLGFARIVFGVRVHGSILAVGMIALIGGFTFSCMGLLVAARPTTIEGVSGLMNLVMLPMWLLSGTFFSSDRFPAAVQPFIKVLPLTAINTSLRAVINEGASLASTWPQLAVMAVVCIVTFVFALKLFRWQ